MNSHGREEKRREEKRRLLTTNSLPFKLLIVLLSLILSFSISCKSNEEPAETPPPEPTKPPEETPKHELEGTWIGYDKKDTKYENYELKFTVDSDGNITFSPRQYRQEVEFVVTNITTNDVTITNIVTNTITNIRNYTYTGKVETNSITYPYDAEVFCKGTDGGTFKFSNSSSCAASYDRIDFDKQVWYLNLTNGKFEYNNKDGVLNLSVTTVEFKKQ